MSNLNHDDATGVTHDYDARTVHDWLTSDETLATPCPVHDAAPGDYCWTDAEHESAFLCPERRATARAAAIASNPERLAAANAAFAEEHPA
ncbi:hypothetical protein M2317_002196 [Microbacterium sp. ZKA21]|uniref:hypothetical protein n=1 Tax=Microbacterium sp. ZKA21 TaxID=3381694 RepID=UPI003D1F0519